ncbi:MAG: zf-TFIIB domain-containing protein [Acidobacteriota bacterium]
MLVSSNRSRVAGALNCPNCGGSAVPHEPQCSWCGSVLATVACRHCFGAIFLGARHCSWCGEEAIQPEEAKEKKGGPCPRCNEPLVPIKIETCELCECRECGGVWVDNSSFERICADREQQEVVLGRPQEAAEPSLRDRKKGARLYVPCPTCGQLMNRINFAGCSGVILDWCKPHGTWLDRDEFPKIIAFIRTGGLRKARERDKEHLRAEERRLRLKEAQLNARSTRDPRSDLQWNNSWDDNGGSLLSFLSSVWPGLGE